MEELTRLFNPVNPDSENEETQENPVNPDPFFTILKENFIKPAFKC
jgi:hypothetical protein